MSRDERPFEKILDYLDERSPRGALNVKLAIRRAVEAIRRAIQASDVLMGKGGTRAMPVSRYPYLIYWTVEANEVRVIHIRHGARRPSRG